MVYVCVYLHKLKIILVTHKIIYAEIEWARGVCFLMIIKINIRIATINLRWYISKENIQTVALSLTDY